MSSGKVLLSSKKPNPSSSALEDKVGEEKWGRSLKRTACDLSRCHIQKAKPESGDGCEAGTGLAGGGLLLVGRPCGVPPGGHGMAPLLHPGDTSPACHLAGRSAQSQLAGWPVWLVKLLVWVPIKCGGKGAMDREGACLLWKAKQLSERYR